MAKVERDVKTHGRTSGASSSHKPGRAVRPGGDVKVRVIGYSKEVARKSKGVFA